MIVLEVCVCVFKTLLKIKIFLPKIFFSDRPARYLTLLLLSVYCVLSMLFLFVDWSYNFALRSCCFVQLSCFFIVIVQFLLIIFNIGGERNNFIDIMLFQKEFYYLWCLLFSLICCSYCYMNLQTGSWHIRHYPSRISYK